MSVFDVRLVVLGSSEAGKSALLHRLVYGRYHRSIPPTYGTEFGATRVQVTFPEASARGGSDAQPSGGGGRSGGTQHRGNGSRSATLGIWDTSGSSRFHSHSRGFIKGAHAVLVCWDACSRSSWDAMRSWVAEARAEEPEALVFIAGTKCDLVELRQREDPPAEEIEVEVEHWRPQGRPQAQAAPAAHPAAPAEGAGKPPLAGGRGGGLGRPPAAPLTPVKSAERPWSPVAGGEGPEAGAEAAEEAGGVPHEAAVAAAARQQLLADHEQAAAAEVVSSLTGQPLPSPFARAAGRPLSPPEREAGSSGSPAGPGARGSAALSPPSHAATSVSEWEALSPQHSRQPSGFSGGMHDAPGSQREGGEGGAADGGGAAACSRHVHMHSPTDSEEGEHAAAPQLQQLAVPEAAVDDFCSRNGARIFWVSARSGEGVRPAFTAIAQAVMEQRWQQQQQDWQQQQQQQRGRQQQQGRQRLGRAATAAATPGASQRSLSAGDLRGRSASAAQPGSGQGSGTVARYSSSASPQGRREYVLGSGDLAPRGRAAEEPCCVQ